MTIAGALAGLSVVELGDGTACLYAAKMLGDFGADVVKIESPAGDSSRRRGPFPQGRADPEASGLFLYLNINKRGAAIDIDTADGRTLIDRLLGRADIFVTNLPGERLRKAGLAPKDLRARHKRLIITSISPFGAEGPWANRRGDELVTYAMAGIAYSTPGMPDASEDLERELPLHPSCFAAETIAGAIAATATMAAVLGREKTQDGCLVEVSQQAAVAAMQQRDVTTNSYTGKRHDRLLNPTVFGRMPNFYLPCRDGYITCAAPVDHQWERLVEAMGRPDWALAPMFADSASRMTHWSELRLHLIAWTMTLTGDELFALAGRMRLPLFPFYSLRKMIESEHARARGTLADVEIGGHHAQIPAAPFGMRATPWAFRRPAPRLGEHTTEILQSLLGVPA